MNIWRARVNVPEGEWASEARAQRRGTLRNCRVVLLLFLRSDWRGLTPELSRTAARNGGVVHVTMQPSREAVSA